MGPRKRGGVKKIKELYVGVVGMRLPDGTEEEVVIFGHGRDKPLQASVDPRPEGVPPIIEMCEASVEMGKMADGTEITSWRLLHFTEPKEIDPDPYRPYEDFCFSSRRH